MAMCVSTPKGFTDLRVCPSSAAPPRSRKRSSAAASVCSFDLVLHGSCGFRILTWCQAGCYKWPPAAKRWRAVGNRGACSLTVKTNSGLCGPASRTSRTGAAARTSASGCASACTTRGLTDRSGPTRICVLAGSLTRSCCSGNDHANARFSVREQTSALPVRS